MTTNAEKPTYHPLALAATTDRIIELTAEEFGVTVEQLMNPVGQMAIDARAVAIRIAYGHGINLHRLVKTFDMTKQGALNAINRIRRRLQNKRGLCARHTRIVQALGLDMLDVHEL